MTKQLLSTYCPSPSSEAFSFVLPYTGRNLEKAIMVFFAEIRGRFPSLVFKFQPSMEQSGGYVTIVVTSPASDISWDMFMKTVDTLFRQNKIRYTPPAAKTYSHLRQEKRRG